MRIIDLDFYADKGSAIFLGYAGEHLSTVLNFHMPAELGNNDCIYVINFLKDGENSSNIISHFAYKTKFNTNIVEYYIPSSIMGNNTSSGIFQLVAYGMTTTIGNEVKYSILGKSTEFHYVIDNAITTDTSDLTIELSESESLALQDLIEAISRLGNIETQFNELDGLTNALGTFIEKGDIAYTLDSTTMNVTYNAANPKIIYTNAHINNKNAFVFTTANNYYQIALCYDGTEYKRELTAGGSTTYKPWVLVNNENTGNKKATLTGNESSNDFYPTTKAVADALSTKAPASTAYTFDTTTTNVVYNTANPKTIYLNATVDGEDGIVITAKDNDFQYFLGRGGTLKIRHFSGGTSYSNWTQVTEHIDNKKNSITNANRTSTDYYPSIKAVVDYLVANYENLSNKLTSEEGIGSDSTDTKYPSAKAVYDLGVEILALVNDDISNVESRLVLKESASNKQSSITAVNKASTALYPSIKAVYDYGSQISSAVEDVKAYIGYTSGDILGLHADFENKVFTRLGAAVGLNAGSDFNAFPMYGQRRRVVVDSNGVIDETESPENITENDTNVDVMVYQPKFYYKVVPLKLEKQSSGLGYHIRKANYYISSTPHAGFKLHPLFFDKNGNEIDYVLFSAYEASYMWRRQVSTNGTDFRYVDSIFHDGVNTDTTIETSAVLKSLPDVKPISGQYKAFNKTNAEILAQNKSSNWHLDTIKSVSANQLLMAIEYGTFNTQNAIGKGIVYNETSGSDNCSSLTGSTFALGNVTGMAGETIYDVAGTETPFNTNGKVAVSYRGMENPWGNIWKQVNGINFWGDGNMGGGQAYICSDFNFDESKHIGNYKSTGFSIVNVDSLVTAWVSAFGYGNEEYDWLFIPSEGTGNNSLPVGDSCACTQNLNGNRIAVYGGRWSSSEGGGGFYWACGFVPNYKNSEIGGRLLFVPTATV